MINIEHLDKTYHLKNADVHAVDDVSLHILVQVKVLWCDV